jgi:hypothetical protein
MSVSERPSHVENEPLLRYYEACSGNSLPTFRGQPGGSILKSQRIQEVSP